MPAGVETGIVLSDERRTCVTIAAFASSAIRFPESIEETARSAPSISATAWVFEEHVTSSI